MPVPEQPCAVPEWASDFNLAALVSTLGRKVCLSRPPDSSPSSFHMAIIFLKSTRGTVVHIMPLPNAFFYPLEAMHCQRWPSEDGLVTSHPQIQRELRGRRLSIAQSMWFKKGAVSSGCSCFAVAESLRSNRFLCTLDNLFLHLGY